MDNFFVYLYLLCYLEGLMNENFLFLLITTKSLMCLLPVVFVLLSLVLGGDLSVLSFKFYENEQLVNRFGVLFLSFHRFVYLRVVDKIKLIKCLLLFDVNKIRVTLHG